MTEDNVESRSGSDSHDELSPEAIEKLVQSVHPEKEYEFLPGFDRERLAKLYGLTLQEYEEFRSQFEENAHEAANELLTDRSFAHRVDRLPFQTGETIVGIGESVTADRQSWLVILDQLLMQRRGDDEIQIRNEGISGTTTTEALERMPSILSQQPDWIICFLGAADAVRHGVQARKTAVSTEETAMNLAELRHLAEAQTSAQWVWITPPTINEELASNFPPFQMSQFTLLNEDLTAVGNSLRPRSSSDAEENPVRESDPVIDIQSVFERPAPSEFVQADGVHPSLVGHQAIAKAVVKQLTERSD
ncbi:MAG TPA: GDSL-type esterase/lipase family protein [Methanomicrobiales archaeon]|nr:GDSL-type esterase/lipase family protein [Methanomicrobiales archaeon]